MRSSELDLAARTGIGPVLSRGATDSSSDLCLWKVGAKLLSNARGRSRLFFYCDLYPTILLPTVGVI